MEMLEVDVSLLLGMESSSRLVKLLREMVCSEMSVLARFVLESRVVDLEDLAALA
mgnify:CR=1 FL=1